MMQSAHDQMSPRSTTKRARERAWNSEERYQHQLACQGKQKLTFSQKLEIIRLYELEDGKKYKQSQLAKTFGKSRSAISKILRPEAIERIKSTAQAGVDTAAMRRYITPEHFDLEQKLYDHIQNTFNPPVGEETVTITTSTVIQCAVMLAEKLGLTDFKPNTGWLSRFLKRYGLTKPPPSDEGAPSSPKEPNVPSPKVPEEELLPPPHLDQPEQQQASAPPSGAPSPVPHHKLRAPQRQASDSSSGAPSQVHHRHQQTPEQQAGAPLSAAQVLQQQALQQQVVALLSGGQSFVHQSHHHQQSLPRHAVSPWSGAASAEPEAVHLTKVAVVVKVGFITRGQQQVENMRRLEVTYELDEAQTPFHGYDSTMGIFRNIYREELNGLEPRITYKVTPPTHHFPCAWSPFSPTCCAALSPSCCLSHRHVVLPFVQDEDGDDITIGSDKELSMAVQMFQGLHGGVVKMTVMARMSGRA